MPMADVDLLVVVVVGLLAAFLIGGRRFGLIGDLIAGLVGAFISRWLFIYQFHIAIIGKREGFNFETGGILWWIDAALTAALGAIILLVLPRLLNRRR